MAYLIRPTDPERLASWVDRLGRETLPVADFRPRLGAGGPVFDIDVNRLTAVERARLAGHMADTLGGSYYESLEQLVNIGAAVPAIGCELIAETAVSAGSGEL